MDDGEAVDGIEDLEDMVFMRKEEGGGGSFVVWVWVCDAGYGNVLQVGRVGIYMDGVSGVDHRRALERSRDETRCHEEV